MTKAETETPNPSAKGPPTGAGPLALELVSIPSETGRELTVLEFFESLAACQGLLVTRIPVSPGRYNLYIRHPEGKPSVLLTTHLDTVPGGPTPVLRNGILYARGACDAKGIAAAMWCALLSLIQAGARHTALLLVVGEEQSSDGAKAAAKAGLGPFRYFVNGEPTELQFIRAQRGVVSAVIETEGKTAHSGYPALGRSAIHSLLDILAELRGTSWPEDPVVGPTLLNIGRIEGGEAPNMLAARARAQVMIRVATSAQDILRILEERTRDRAKLTILTQSDPQQLYVPPGPAFDSAIVAGFGSDVAHLRALGTPLMLGPGSITDAHSETENVKIADLDRAVIRYAELCAELAAQGDPR